VSLLRIVSKGLKEPGDKLQLLKVLSLGQVLDALEAKTRAQQIERGDDRDEGEESYREALGKLLNVLGLELSKLIDVSVSHEQISCFPLIKYIQDCSDEDIRTEASTEITQIQPVMLRFMADEYDDTCSTVFPLLQNILTTVRCWLMQIYMIDNSDCSTNAIGKYLQIH
jgi:exportin-T